ncbi:MAG: hypothetical protein ACYDHZ_06240 [Dehalococcoidia bacterium]
MTIWLNVKNNAESTLASGITAVATSLTVAAGEGVKFPASNFNITIDGEILLCTSRTGDVLTVTRAQEGTAAAVHAAAAAVSLFVTAGIISQIQAAIPDVGVMGDISTQAFADSPAAGATGRYADAGHKHGMPAAPSGSDKSARVYHNADQTIANNTLAALAFNSERWDTDNIHDNVTNNSRLTCKTAGKYLIVGNANFAANATGRRGIMIRVNGTDYIAIQQFMAVSDSGASTGASISIVYSLAVNDYVELVVKHLAGADLVVTYTALYSPEFMMIKIA